VCTYEYNSDTNGDTSNNNEILRQLQVDTVRAWLHYTYKKLGLNKHSKHIVGYKKITMVTAINNNQINVSHVTEKN